MKKILFLVLFCPLFASAQKQLTDSNYRVYSVKLNKEVSLNDIVKDMANYDVLFLGEEHNDSVTHFLEKTMLGLLYNEYKTDVVLSMEMFERDVQPVMNEYLKGFITERYFKRDARVWSNYRDYRPMVEFAKEKGLDVICANAAARYTSLAGRKGQQALLTLPDVSKDFIAPLPYDTATGAYYAKLTALPKHDTVVVKAKTNDKDKDKTKPVDPMAGMGSFNLVVAQSLWDATMAYSIAEYRRQSYENKMKKIMQVNGRFHSDEGFAVVAQLKTHSPRTRSLIISTSDDEHFPNIKWDDYKKNGDYIIITDPKVPKTYSDSPPKEKEKEKVVKEKKKVKRTKRKK